MATTTEHSTTATVDRAAPAAGADTRAALAPLLFGFFPAQVLHVGATLGLTDLVAGRPMTSAQLAEATGTDEPSLYRVLRALACFGILDEPNTGTFAAGTYAAGLMADHPVSLQHLVRLFAGPEVWRSWGELDVSVRTGEPSWDRVTGAPSFEYMRTHPELQAVFNRAMTEGTRNAAPGIVDVGGFRRFSWVIDVGGGDGTLLAAVLASHPGLRGTLLDTEDGLAGAEETLAGAGVADRATAVTGDFFASVPEGPDVYLIKSVIHDWDDERAAAILRNVRDAMPADGVLLVVEPVMPPAPAPTTDVLMMVMMVMSDLNMLVCTGGKERTEAEFRTLLAGAGFDVVSVAPVTGPTNYSVLEAVPAR